MRSDVPMDRLVCGDVGYGKTEIAVRAAFKAVQDGKQVAVLVPTTLLVTQHLSTFAERMSGFPVVIKGAVSRFQTDKEAREVIDGPGRRHGRHRDRHPPAAQPGHPVQGPRADRRRRGAAVRRRAQGADEAAAHRGRRAVDVARRRSRARWRWRSPASARCPRSPPRPRSGTRCSPTSAPTRTARSSPPIRRELLREGQVFYIHNRVQSIEKAAARIRELVPEARVATAHGQMGEHQLEQVMLDFWEKRFDVLVCTTIVESGLDVSNANTMIIERADTLGLSQLHQLRGRVGRSRERAYAYFLYPAGEAAHRDRPRAAGHARPALRPRRRHGDRDEGPRDPRRRQPARRRAVRPHRRRRLRPLRPAGRRGGRTSSAADAEPELDEVRIELPVDAHLPARLHPERAAAAGDVQAAGRGAHRRRRRPARARSWSTATASRRSRSPSLLLVARFRARARQAGHRARSRSPGKYVRFAPVDLPDSRVVRLQRLYPEVDRQGPGRDDPGAAAADRRRRGKPIDGIALLEWAHGVIDAVVDPQEAKESA